MQAKEVTQQISLRKLREALEINNDTPFSVEDVMTIVESNDGPWTEPMNQEQFDAYLRANGIEI